MDIATLRSTKALTQQAFAARYGLSSKGHVADLESGRRQLSHALALRIFDLDGVKLGPIAHLSDDDAKVLLRLQSAA